MPSDSRLSRVLHLLIHLDRHAGAATSELLAGMLSTNPVVVRRMMAGLREAGLVVSERGHGGGWMLARSLAEITLLDVHQALGAPSPFAIGIARDDPRCLVEQAVNTRLSDTLREAEALLLERFGAISLGDLAADFDCRMAQHRSHLL
ncbi:Rrf2 family transcriptional regulator [Mesorhizobium microcysteis]|uniref:Rrf2 family transcriptional regulator n=1 Tax=Neoaquamicrobium microcysteis TaxID=2682781 RepID=A0A5D4GQK9_9HYPH|nr:Rrf2 family transcriptional regulator [Mesorhizobium microcysteis]TYR31036.1 Rrf2 family transcriptional regulator [Mesorhizobium microcysteis]